MSFPQDSKLDRLVVYAHLYDTTQSSLVTTEKLCLTWQGKKKIFFFSPHRIKISTGTTASGPLSGDKPDGM